MAGNLDKLHELFPEVDSEGISELMGIDQDFFADEVRFRLASLGFVDRVSNFYSEPANDGYSEVFMANIQLKVFGKERKILWTVRSDDTSDEGLRPAKSITNSYVDLEGEPGQRAAIFEPVLLKQRDDGSWIHTSQSPPFPDYSRGPWTLAVHTGFDYYRANVGNMLEYRFSPEAEQKYLGMIAHLSADSKEIIEGTPAFRTTYGQE